MELIKFAVRRSKVSDVVYILLNVAYAATLFVLVTPSVDLPYLAYLLVVLSKWRVIAVRPRFWFANFQANFIDFLVGISSVTLMLLTASSTPTVAVLIALLYALWLLILKPHTGTGKVLSQAMVGQFVSLTALFSIAHAFEFKPFITDSSLLTVVIAWIVGYMAARHALSSYKHEEDRTLLSLIWGFVVAELSWLAHHWTIAYSLYNEAGAVSGRELMIPQVAITITLMSLVVIRWYEWFHNTDDKKAFKDARSVTVFSTIVITILLVFFNGSLDITAL